MEHFEFEYEGRKVRIEKNGCIYEWRTSQYMPNDPPTWYRCNNLTVWSPIAKMFFEMLQDTTPKTTKH